jgi:hypothetical protein
MVPNNNITHMRLVEVAQEAWAELDLDIHDASVRNDVSSCAGIHLGRGLTYKILDAVYENTGNFWRQNRR